VLFWFVCRGGGGALFCVLGCVGGSPVLVFSLREGEALFWSFRSVRGSPVLVFSLREGETLFSGLFAP